MFLIGVSKIVVNIETCYNCYYILIKQKFGKVLGSVMNNQLLPLC